VVGGVAALRVVVVVAVVVAMVQWIPLTSVVFSCGIADDSSRHASISTSTMLHFLTVTFRVPYFKDSGVLGGKDLCR
jgi:hypothetical protein